MQTIAFNDLSRQTAIMRDALLEAAMRVVDSGWYVMGRELEAFEQEFAAYCHCRHAVGVASGTDAIEIALRALGIGPGDEVVLVANAGMYSAAALHAIGARPVYVDVEPEYLDIDVEAVCAVVGPRTRAVIATHLYGRMVDVARLRELCDRHALALVEDCAQAHGATFEGRRAGSWGDAAAFSFYPTKNLGALGDAGMVTCADANVAAHARRLRQYGWERKYHAIEGPGRNSRLDEIQAATLRAKLPHLDRWNTRRRAIAARYAEVGHHALRHPDVTGDDYVAHLYVVRSPYRDALKRHLAERGIASEIHYPLLDTQQPAMRGTFTGSDLHVGSNATAEVLSLPCYPELTNDEVERVCAALAEWAP